MKIRFFAAAGFTLTELLITLSLMTVIYSVLFSMMSGGIGVWQRLKCGVRQEHEIYFGLDQIRRGLHAFHAFEPISFKGSNDKIEFPALVDLEADKDGEITQEPGQVRLYFDRARQTLCKSERPYRGLKRENRKIACEVLAQNVDKVAFSYHAYNPKSKSFAWSGYWSEKHPPVSVKVELDYHDPCSEKKSKKEFLVAIPVGPIG